MRNVGANFSAHYPDQSKAVIIGVGNEYRRDDGAGVYAARKLEQFDPSVRVIVRSGEGASLMELWRCYDKVIIIDAVQSGVAPGTIHKLDAGANSIPSDFFHYSSHAFGVAEAVELARSLGTLPRNLIIFGVEGADFSAGKGLTAMVQRAADKVCDLLLQELRISSVSDWRKSILAGDQRGHGNDKPASSRQLMSGARRIN